VGNTTEQSVANTTMTFRSHTTCKSCISFNIPCHFTAKW